MMMKMSMMMILTMMMMDDDDSVMIIIKHTFIPIIKVLKYNTTVIKKPVIPEPSSFIVR
jgi:hypothetical protein